MKPKNQVLEVWGDYACFSRPEMKVERFSYPVVTPSAARGIFDAIYCKPKEFRWQVTRVEILTPPSYIALRRNEVKEKASTDSVKKWMKGSADTEPIWADANADNRGRTQRQTMALRDVKYRLHGEVRPWPGFEDRLQGMEAQFRRRAKHGKCIYQPYFGCREFPAFFELIEPHAPPPQRAHLEVDIGIMLYDVFDLSRPGGPTDEPCISLFHALVNDGALDVPDYADARVLKGVRRER